MYVRKPVEQSLHYVASTPLFDLGVLNI